MTDESQSADDELAVLQSLKFVGPATAEVLAAADIEPDRVREKRISYRQLVELGANHGVASKIRREHSLPWTITGEEGGDLDKRSDQVRGLRDGERQWVAASSGDWESAATTETGAEADGSGAAEAAEAAWRDRSSPTPLEELEDVPAEAVEKLASAGVTSVRSLATVSPAQVADLLELDEEDVAEWREVAAERT